MASFLEDEPQMVIDYAIDIISEQLFDNWQTGNLDEGDMYADYQFAEMSGDPYLQDKFNKFYNLTPEHEYYFEVSNV